MERGSVGRGEELRHLAPVGDRPHLEQPAAVEPAEAVVAHPSARAAAVGEELAREEVAEHAASTRWREKSAPGVKGTP